MPEAAISCILHSLTEDMLAKAELGRSVCGAANMTEAPERQDFQSLTPTDHLQCGSARLECRLHTIAGSHYLPFIVDLVK